MAHEDILKILIAERNKLDQAISILQSGNTRPGRPRKNEMPIANSVKPRRGQRRWSAAQRKAASERTRARWAARKQAAQKTVKGGRKKAAKKTTAA